MRGAAWQDAAAGKDRAARGKAALESDGLPDPVAFVAGKRCAAELQARRRNLHLHGDQNECYPPLGELCRFV